MDEDRDLFETFPEIVQKLEDLKRRCLLSEISRTHYNKCLFDVFGGEKKKAWPSVMKLVLAVCRWIFMLVTFVAVAYFLVSFHNPTKRFLSRNVQGLIYPTMRLFRLWTLPWVKNFDITHMYQKVCLVKSPFYVEPPLECWPCENIRFVADLSGTQKFTEAYYQSGIPFVTKGSFQKPVSYADLQELYFQHKSVLQKGTSDFSTLNSPPLTLDDVFHSNISAASDSDFHAQWGINRISAVQVIRQVFKRPSFIPLDTEIALLRYIFLDGVQSPSYELPLTDFVNVWLAQASGSRLIVLIPSPQCKTGCNVVSILLHPTDILFYNWQYWRPWSYAVNVSQDVGITYMGSSY